MERYLTSNAKSAVSMEDTRECGTQTTAWEGITDSVEAERLNRKIDLLERAKMMLWQEMSLCKEENHAFKKRIKQVESALHDSQKHFKTLPENNQGTSVNQVKVALSEKQEELGLVQQELRKKEKEIQKLTKTNEYLVKQLDSKVQTLTIIRQSSLVQKDCFLKEIEALESELKARLKKEEEAITFNQHLLSVESGKWKQINSQLCSELEQAYNSINDLKAKIQHIERQRKAHLSQVGSLEKQLAEEQEKGEWLTGLLDEAKGQFIHATLVHGEEKERAKREKKELERRARWLRSRIKGSSQEGSTAANSALSSCKSSRISGAVAPFHLTPKPRGHGESGGSSSLSLIAIDSSSMQV